jgi:hypothetical protein
LVLADRMTDMGYVSMPRSELASVLNRTPRRITDRIQSAKDKGFLDVVRTGAPGRTAEYFGVIPVGADARTKRDGAVSSTHSGADGSTKQPWAKRTPHGADVGEASTRVTYVTETPTPKSAPTSSADDDESAVRLAPCGHSLKSINTSNGRCADCIIDNLQKASA